ncbi:hypothetical protein D9619_004337 [Psilocybe cf. subviscida]|uniref:Indoleamine 2,3-dioxygenase n=1 Tax=Psilocybe cf. subviscida TaxID=2480587 RepID=A0A8H5BRF8_9AGAR|nr:hypothetical protein D9619_004337 [Psilocybe cf. subviscida]
MGHTCETAVQYPSTSITRQFLCGGLTTSYKNAIQPAASEDSFGAQYNIDRHTGFMAPRPRTRLPGPWDLWEDTLDIARQANLQVGDKIGLKPAEEAASRAWRDTARQMQVLATKELESSETLLRHAHVVLAHILHFYVHTLPPSSPVSIPSSISVPLLYISQRLGVPPVITYADNVLYNWTMDGSTSSAGSTDDLPTVANVRSMTTFTNLVDEEEFYLASARIELRGVEALDIMDLTLKEVRNVSDDGQASAVKRITTRLLKLSGVIDNLKDLLMDTKRLCDPDRYYNQVRPWLRGEDAFSTPVRTWIFEGIEAHPELRRPHELSGPSAGQSSLIHALDVFFGVDHEAESGSTSAARRTSLMTRMREYMPLEQRRFLNQLRETAPSVRQYIVQTRDEGLLAAFNRAVSALKGFRDAHMIIVTLYILGPARRAAALQTRNAGLQEQSTCNSGNSGGEVVKGTGGTDMVKFLKETRARTTNALLSN